MFAHLKLEFLILGGLILGYLGRAFLVSVRKYDVRDTVILSPTLIERSVRQPHVRPMSKSPVLGAPYTRRVPKSARPDDLLAAPVAVNRFISKSPILGAPYALQSEAGRDSDEAQHCGICPDCGGVTEMYERMGESQWPDAWMEHCTGCGNMVEHPHSVNLWDYAGPAPLDAGGHEHGGKE
jgi:hypothetical protein